MNDDEDLPGSKLSANKTAKKRKSKIKRMDSLIPAKKNELKNN
jgi:hypothetical protein